jgi:hypothetical protein
MKRTTWNKLVLTMAALAAVAPSRAANREARLTRAEGVVAVTSAEGDGTIALAEGQDMPLEAGDRVRTGADGAAEIALDGETVMELGPSSDFTLHSLRRSHTLFGLDLGSVVATIKKLAAKEKMEFKTPVAVAAVRGTELAVAQNPTGETAVGVFDEGQVEVRGEGAPVRVGPNQETEVRRGKPPRAPRELRGLAGRRERLGLLRERRPRLAKAWRPRPVAERRSLRLRRWGPNGKPRTAPPNRGSRPGGAARPRPGPSRPR